MAPSNGWVPRIYCPVFVNTLPREAELNLVDVDCEERKYGASGQYGAQEHVETAVALPVFYGQRDVINKESKHRSEYDMIFNNQHCGTGKNVATVPKAQAQPIKNIFRRAPCSAVMK